MQRQDLQHLIEWCDREPPFGWLKSVAGVALTVRPVVAVNTRAPRATALWTGDLALREMPGISELPEEPVDFVGSLVGVRNPARRSQLSIRADVDRTVARLSGDAIPAAWRSGSEIERVRDELGLLSAEWTLEDPAGTQQLFELLIWPALRQNVDLGPP